MLTSSLLATLKLPEDLKSLSHSDTQKIGEEVRGLILSTVSENGGHLAPNLGVVELTLALLRVLDPIKDRIVWDVGHQCYAYKILTDRLHKFSTLRKIGGISGFINPTESPYDSFGVGHASTSISAALGIVTADAILGINRKVVAVIGDGALSGGLAFEGLNNLGISRKPMVVVLNDNGMFIGSTVGAVSQALSKMATGESAYYLRDKIKNLLNLIDSYSLNAISSKIKASVLSFFTTGIFFEELGLRYIGPIDGHDLPSLEKALSNAFSYKCPVIVHIKTQKGKGYHFSEKNPNFFHGVPPFNVETGMHIFSEKDSWSSALGKKLVELSETNKEIVAISAAMSEGTGLSDFSEKYPDRFFDVGIAEQHSMTFAAGLAISGLKPYFVVYSTFLQRAYDQLIHDVALQNLPVKICVDRGGLVGSDGSTHHGIFDISFLLPIPNLVIMAPRNTNELKSMLELSLSVNSPVVIRYPKGSSEPFLFKEFPEAKLEFGKYEILSEGKDLAILTVGHAFIDAYELYKRVLEKGKKITFINLRFIKPIDVTSLLDQLKEIKYIVTFEENLQIGGVGSFLQNEIFSVYPDKKIIKIALPDIFPTHGSNKELKIRYNSTPEDAIEQLQIYGFDI